MRAVLSSPPGWRGETKSSEEGHPPPLDLPTGPQPETGPDPAKPHPLISAQNRLPEGFLGRPVEQPRSLSHADSGSRES